MKTIYFVRHGEAEVNVSDVFGDGSSPLTPRGHEQAAFIAQRASKLPLEKIVASTMVRAQETAAHIAKRTGHPIESTDLFVERRRPSEHLGARKDDPRSIEITQTLIDHFSEPGYRFSDEENFEDLRERAGQALTHLEQMPEKHILVVTHGFFLRVLVAVAVFGKNLSGEECDRFIRTFHMENTGLSVLGFDPKFEKSPWWVWNDHAHLG